MFLNNVDDMRNCKDQAGATTGIPDIPFLAAQLVQQCSDESFPIVPPPIQCDTKDQHPQTYDANIARGYYFTKKYGELHGIYVFNSDSQIGHAMTSSPAALGGLRDVGGAERASTPTPTSPCQADAHNKAPTRPSSRR